jgi:hypothetical protein
MNELILNFPVKFNLFGFKARMVGAALIMNRMEKVILFRSWIFYMQDLNVKIGPYT